MKKILAIMLAIAMMVSLTACGVGGSAAKPQEPAANESDPAEESDSKVYNIGICQLVQHAALDAATQGFKDALVEKLGEENVVFDEQNAAGDAATCTTICNSLISTSDLMMGNATAALQAAVSATSTIPVLGTSVTDYATALDIDDWTGTVGGNVSGTSDLAPLDAQAAMVKELFPKAETVGILYCSGEPNSIYQRDVITAELENLGFTVKEFGFADSNDVASVTQVACGECDVIYIPTDNTAASCTEAINNIAIVEEVPIVAGEAGICGGCGVATLSIDYYDLGYATGIMAYKILAEGADISEMPVEFAPNTEKLYNESICATLGIKAPEGYNPLG